jgi:hypothetical protein
MAPPRKARSALTIWFLCHLSFASGQQIGDPTSTWLGIVGLIQNGERLAGDELRPLALGCFLEAHHQIVELARVHPHFEPELIAYRIGSLSEEIAAAGSQTVDENEISLKFRSYIQLLEQGQTLHFRNEFEPALSHLKRAKVLLEEIDGDHPGEFDIVLKPRRDQVEAAIAWLSAQVAYRKANPLPEPVRPATITKAPQFAMASLKSPDLVDSGEPTKRNRRDELKPVAGPPEKRNPDQIRIFVLGDSQSQTSFGPEFQKRLVDAGHEVFFHGVKNGTPYFWGGKWRSPVLTRQYSPASSPGEGGRFKDVSMKPRSVSDYVASVDPDIFVFQAGTNFENILAGEDVNEIERLIGEYTQIAASRGARVLWIGPPDARDNVRSVKKQDKASATLRSALGAISEAQGYSCFFDSRPVCPITNDTGGDGEHPTHQGGIAWAVETARWVDDSISRLRCDGNLRSKKESGTTPTPHFLTQQGFDETAILANALSMKLQLVAKSDPGDIRTFPYTDAFSVYRYTLQNTAEVLPSLTKIGLAASPDLVGGTDTSASTIYVLHWAVHNDGNGPRATQVASWKVGGIHDMQLVPLAGHPLKDALGTMTQFNDFDDWLAPIFVSTRFLEEREY